MEKGFKFLPRLAPLFEQFGLLNLQTADWGTVSAPSCLPYLIVGGQHSSMFIEFSHFRDQKFLTTQRNNKLTNLQHGTFTVLPIETEREK